MIETRKPLGLTGQTLLHRGLACLSSKPETLNPNKAGWAIRVCESPSEAIPIKGPPCRDLLGHRAHPRVPIWVPLYKHADSS